MSVSAHAPGGLEAVEDCRRLSLAMLEAAGRDEWQEVARLDEERTLAMARFQLDELDPGAFSAAAAAVRELLTLNARLEERAEQARQASLVALRRARGGSRGSSAYRKLSAAT